MDHVIRELQSQLREREEQHAITTSDKMRFKELSENYMQEVAHLESQLGEAQIKPLSKMSQRPLDTEVRAQSHSHAIKQGQRVKRVEAKQLTEVTLLLKLLLQARQVLANSPDALAPLLFEGTEIAADDELSIDEMKTVFEHVGLSAKKSTLVARYLIEPESQDDILYNESMRADVSQILLKLKELVGEYCLYASNSDQVDVNNDDSTFIQEEYMQRMVFSNFWNQKETLLESLKCEDYEEEGIIELT